MIELDAMPTEVREEWGFKPGMQKGRAMSVRIALKKRQMPAVRIALCAAVWLCILSGVAIAQEAAPSVLTRVVNVPAILDVPTGSCSVPSLAAYVTKHLGVPATLEMLPIDCGKERRSPAVDDRIHLQGRTLEEALDAMVKADPRYYWIEREGVIVLRPTEAWADKEHFLATMMPRLDLKDASVGAAFDTVTVALDPSRGITGELLLGNQPANLTISIGPISVGEALDAIARAHGAMYWMVRCFPERSGSVPSIEMRTHDDRGLVRPIRPNGADRKWVERCRKN